MTMSKQKKDDLFVPRAIGVAHTPFHDLDAIPKGPGTKHEAIGIIEVLPELETALTDIEGFSHLFIIWVFDRSEGFDLLDAPPGEETLHGLFTTRSPRRPNPIALTVVELLDRDGPRLRVFGVDMLDGTPILDIKPYTSSVPIEKIRRGWQGEFELRRREKST
jgi:tRNA (adenine37-N6)-methyltransferase